VHIGIGFSKRAVTVGGKKCLCDVLSDSPSKSVPLLHRIRIELYVLMYTMNTFARFKVLYSGSLGNDVKLAF
jgi:hypothetical protein